MNHLEVQRAIDGRNLSDLAQLLSLLQVKLEQLPAPPSPILPDVFDIGIAIEQLQLLIQFYSGFNAKDTSSSAADKSAGTPPTTMASNLPIFRLLSRCLVLVLQYAPTKTYDVANHHLGLITLDGSSEHSGLSTAAEIAIIIAIDLFKSFPNNLGLLISFAISQINKILKKDPSISSNLIYLLATVTENAQRADLDEKTHNKLLKTASKQILLSDVSAQWQSDVKPSETTVLIKQNWLLVCKNLLVISIGTNYESLLSLSTSSNSGARLKPEALMTQQNSFQSSLLVQNAKLFTYGLSSTSKQVRLATVELLAHLLINFIPTGKFSAVEYLLNDLYPIPPYNEWSVIDGKLKEVDLDDDKRSGNSSNITHDPNTNSSNAILNLTQISVIETLILYIQLEQFQNQDYLLNNFTSILDAILAKLAPLKNNPSHIQNTPWVKTLQQLQKLVKFMINECGLTCHELLSMYIHQSFDTKAASEQEPEVVKLKKRESGIFLFKKKGKDKQVAFKEAHPYLNAYQCAILLEILNELLPLGISFNSTSKDTETENSDAKTQENDDTESIDAQYSDDLFVKEVLFKLLINNNSYIRNYSLKSFLIYCKYNGVQLNQLILKSFKIVSHEFKSEASSIRVNSIDNVLNDREVRLLSYSLTLAALLGQADFVDLQTATTTKILSFCTQNLKQASHKNLLQHQACWIILTALVNMYDESEFVRLNLSQFLVFWKSLLTLQLVGDNIDVVANLRVRNFALVCLSNFLEASELTPEVIKQCQMLLSKSYNYITYLENSYEAVGEVTQLQVSSQDNYNINLFSNPFEKSNNLPFEQQLISLIFYSKKILFLLYLKIAHLLKNDVNSSMVIYLLKLFGDSKLFTRSNTNDSLQKKKKSSQVNMNDYFDNSLFLNDDYNYNFGVTSLYANGKLNDLGSLKTPPNGLFYSDPFGDGETAWFDSLEAQLSIHLGNSINFDSTYFLLLHDFSMPQNPPTNLVTSLVDISIELFAQVFPFLASKIQMSLLEQLRVSFTGSQVDSLRLDAISVNLSVMIKQLASCDSKLEKEVVDVLIDIIQKIETKNRQLLDLNCQTLGFLAQRLQKSQIADLIGVISSAIFSDTNPLTRGKAMLQLAYIYQKSEIGFNDVIEIVQQLLVDPNPIVHYYLLKLITIILTKTPEVYQLKTILQKIYSNFLDASFSYDIPSKVLTNTKTIYSSVGEIVSFMGLVVSTLGPMLREEQDLLRNQLKVLLICLKEGINCSTVEDSYKATEGVLLIMQELVIFDPYFVEESKDEVKIGISWFLRYLQFVSSKNMKIAVEVVSPTSRFNDALFPFNSLFMLYKLSYACFSEIVKIQGNSVLDKDAIGLLWVSMNFKPYDVLKELIRFWLAQKYDVSWFTSLSALFRYLSKRLAAPFIEKNYLRKLLPLAQRQKKRDSTKTILKDEESESIVQLEGSEKNEPVTWEFRLFIFDLLIELLQEASKNKQLRDSLIPKIQDIVNVSFLGLTSPVPQVKMQGVRLLDKALELFGELPDPLYPSSSVLEQQQAQIISALMPCFSPQSDAQIIVETIGVLLRFVNLPRIKYYLKQRILRTLIDLLEELALNKYVRFSYIENMSEFNKKAIQLSILNCWAIVKINSQNSEDAEILEILNKYSKLLTSLWILVLREYLSIKYNESSISKREIDNYSNYWINFISVLSLELVDNISLENQVLKSILGDESDNFFFVLFSQCIESLVKGQNLQDILLTMKRLMKSKKLVSQIFEEEIFGEVIDIFDRLVLMDAEDTETKILVVEIVEQIFDLYVKEKLEEQKMQELDKLFELIRICVLPVFHILPNLKSDYDPSNQESQFMLKRADKEINLILLKKCFGCIVGMMVKFPPVVKSDIYACTLFMVTKIYELNNSILILTILPYLKQLVIEVSAFKDADLMTPFSQLICQYSQIKLEDVNSIFTTMVLVTSGNVQLLNNDSEKFVSALLELLGTSDAAMAVQCIKLIILKDSQGPISKLLIDKLVKGIIAENIEFDMKTALELLVFFGAQLTNGKEGFYRLMVPLLLFLEERGNVEGSYIRELVTALAADDAASFKIVLNEALTTEQRSQIEALVKGPLVRQQEMAPQIELKTFGSD